MSNVKTGLDRTDVKAYRKAYYEANKEKQKAYMKAYYEANKDKCLAATKAWMDSNKERVKKVKAEYQQKNKEIIAQRHKKWLMTLRETNPEKYKAMKKAGYEKYKEWHDTYNREASRKRVKQLPDAYIKYVILWNSDKTIEIPQGMIEAKRLQILINRRVKNEERNSITE